MVQKPQWKIQERWRECEKIWEKINQEMENTDLPESDPLENFVNFHDIVKRHVEKDSAREVEISQISSMTLGQVKEFVEHPIKTLAVLQCLSVKLIRYRERAMEIKEVFSTPMDQHRFPYANTCEDLF